MDFAKLQSEHKEWVDREYPEQPARVPLAGMVEEAGELLHAALKLEQEKLWGSDPRYFKLSHDMEDAVGDCAIYCCSLCNAAGQRFGFEHGAVGFATESLDKLQLCAAFVALAASGLTRNDVRFFIDEYLRTLVYISGRFGVDFSAAVERTWARVKLRSRKQAKPRVVCLCGSTRFKDAYVEASKREALAGRIVLSVGCFSHADGGVTEEQKLALDQLHMRKIDRADEILVLDASLRVCECCEKPCREVWDDEQGQYYSYCCGSVCADKPYVGESTRREIAYAKLHGKPVRYLSEE